MAVEFKDNSIAVKRAMSDAVKAFLTERGAEIQSETIDNSRVDTGDTAGSYKYEVSEGGNEAAVSIGSDLENAVWEEYGTGEYAVNGNGRKGGWVYVDAKGVGHFTHGKTPNRPLGRAFDSQKGKIETQLRQKLKQI